MSTALKVLERLTCNLSGTVKRRRMEGKDWLVAPMVMMVEGVHDGDNGPLLYLGKDMEPSAPIWNYKPIVVYHPEDGGSACDPVVLSAQKVGVVMNTRYRKMVTNGTEKRMSLGRLPAEAWLEVDRIKEVDQRVLEALESDTMMEVSTGLYTVNQRKKGVWEGPNGPEEYIAVARRYGPDHLALLPDREGACSIKDGAGLLRLNELANKPQNRGVVAGALQFATDRMRMTINGLSFSDISRRLFDALAVKLGEKGKSWMGWIVDVYDSFVVYQTEGKLYKQSYSLTDGSVALKGQPVPVKVETVYSVANSAKPSVKEKIPMTRIQRVNELIANKAAGWEESDRAFLEKLPKARFDKIVANAKAAATSNDDDEDDDGDDAPVSNKAKAKKAESTKAKQKAKTVENAADDDDDDDDEDDSPIINKKADKGEPAKQVTFNELLATADPATREAIQFGMREANRRKAELIKKITSNENNRFNEKYLKKLDPDTLEGIAALVPDEDGDGDDGILMNGSAPHYLGAQGGVAVLRQNAKLPEVKPLGLPDYDDEEDEE